MIAKKFKGHKVPQGATHYTEKGGDFFILLDQDPLDFVRPFPVHRIMFWTGEKWSEGTMDGEVKMIALPQEPEAYMPKIGEECECLPHNDMWGFKGISVSVGRIEHISGDHFWWFSHTESLNVISRLDKADFRPIKTESEKVVQWTKASIRNEFGEEVLTHESMFGYLHKIGALTIPESKQ